MALDIHNTLGYTCILQEGCHLYRRHETKSRRDQEQGGELDSQEEASPEEIKSREVSWTLRKKPAQKRSRAGR